jgi:phosphate transport system substrate-binding protein
MIPFLPAFIPRSSRCLLLVPQGGLTANARKPPGDMVEIRMGHPSRIGIRENMNRRKLSGCAAGLAATALVLAACGGSDSATQDVTDTSGSADLSGSIVIDGSSTVGPLSEVAAELFMGDYPGVQVTVAQSGTSGGFEKFCKGETDGNNASRPIKESEIEACAEAGIAYDNIVVANDALTLLVNGDNPLQCITVEQARQMWDEGSTVKTWGEVTGLDIPAELNNQPLNLYGPGTDSGTFDFFTEVINGEEGKIRIDYTSIGEDDNAAVTAVRGDIGAIGYVPFSYYQEAGSDVKGLAIDSGNGCIEPTPENVQDGSYTPLGRPLFVYASDTALAKPETVEFFNFYVNNSGRIGEIAGFVGLNDAQVQEQLAKVASLAGN